MRALVTGATGFIGSHLVRHLKNIGVDTVAVIRDHTSSPWTAEVLTDCTRVWGDVRDRDFLRRVVAQYNIDTVYHLAAQPIVAVAQRDPVTTFETNIMGTVNILEASRQVGVDTVVVMSTDKVYGEAKEAVTDTPLKAGGPYETSKTALDMAAQSYAKTYGLKVVIVRFSNAYGYDPHSSRIVPNTIKACMSARDPILFLGEENNGRQYLYVEDVVKVLTCGWEAPLITTIPGEFKTQQEVVCEILEHFAERRVDFVKRPYQLKEIRSQSMTLSAETFTDATSTDYFKIKNMMYNEFLSFKKGIEKTVEMFRIWR